MAPGWTRPEAGPPSDGGLAPRGNVHLAPREKGWGWTRPEAGGDGDRRKDLLTVPPIRRINLRPQPAPVKLAPVVLRHRKKCGSATARIVLAALQPRSSISPQDRHAKVLSSSFSRMALAKHLLHVIVVFRL
jgi:hypothetical protein